MANRRRVEWRAQRFNAANPNNAIVILSGTLLGDDYTKPTIVRVVGSLVIRHGSSGTSLDTGDYSIHRLGVFLGRNAPTFATAAEYEHPWMWTHTMPTHAPHYAVSNGSTGTLQIAKGVGKRDAEVHFDTTVMRKVDTGETLFLRWDVNHISDEGQAPTLFGHIRVLVKE